MGLEIDRAGMFGAGDDDPGHPEPLGLVRTEGVKITDLHGEPLTYAALSRAVEVIGLANEAVSAVILSPRDNGVLDRATDLYGRWLLPPRSLANLPFLDTTKCAVAEDGTTSIVVGGLPQAMLGIRHEVTIDTSNSAANETGSAFVNYQPWLRAAARIDWQLARPAAFAILINVGPEADAGS